MFIGTVLLFGTKFKNVFFFHVFYPRSFQETTENCILNSESAATKPALYTDENQDKVDYFEPGCTGANGRRKRNLNVNNGNEICAHSSNFIGGIENMKSDRHRNVISLKSPDWGSWTRCDGKERHRKRYKGCSSLNPNHCQSSEVICDPSNSKVLFC